MMDLASARKVGAGAATKARRNPIEDSAVQPRQNAQMESIDHRALYVEGCGRRSAGCS